MTAVALPKELAEKAAAALKAAGASGVLTASIVGGQKDYTALIGKLRTAQTQAVYYTGYAIEGGELLRQMRTAGLDAAFLGSDALTADPFAETARDKAEGAKALLAHDASQGVAADAERKVPAQPATGAFVSAYAAIEAWSAAARQAQLNGRTSSRRGAGPRQLRYGAGTRALRRQGRRRSPLLRHRHLAGRRLAAPGLNMNELFEGRNEDGSRRSSDGCPTPFLSPVVAMNRGRLLVAALRGGHALGHQPLLDQGQILGNLLPRLPVPANLACTFA